MPHSGLASLPAEIGAEIVQAHQVFLGEDVEGIVIASSTDSNAYLLGAAAESGKEVFFAKPINLDFSRIEAVSSPTPTSRRYWRFSAAITPPSEPCASVPYLGRLERLVMTVLRREGTDSFAAPG